MRLSANQVKIGNSSASAPQPSRDCSVDPRRVESGSSQYLSGFFKADIQACLPGGRPGTKAAFGAGAEPITELWWDITEGSLNAQFQGSIHRPVRIVEDFPSDRDQAEQIQREGQADLIAVD